MWNTSFTALDITVEVRSGLTSLEPLVYQFSSVNVTSPTWPPSRAQGASPSPLRSEEGFYIRLKGIVYQDDNFFVTFASYSTPTNESSRECGRNSEFYCATRNGGICIDDNFLCDGHAHCPGGEDETEGCQKKHVDPDTSQRASSTLDSPDCRQDDFRCLSGGPCVARDVVCDGTQDCSDGSDELFCDVFSHPGDGSSRPRCQNGSRLCVDSCVTEREVCTDQRCAYLWFRLGCRLSGSSNTSLHIQWSLILPLCFAIFCVFILLGVIVIRLRKQPKIYIDPNCHNRRCRRVPLVPRVIRSFTPHGHCMEGGSSCSANSSVGLLSCSTSFSGGSTLADPCRPGGGSSSQPHYAGHFLQSPTFDIPLSPTTHAGSPSVSVASRETAPYFNFEQFQTSVT